MGHSEYYVDRTTGDVTQDQKTAIRWHNAGHLVEVWKGDKRVKIW